MKNLLLIPQLHHAHDSFLALTTDGINFIMNSQEICNVINQCSDPKEAAQRISEQVSRCVRLLSKVNDEASNQLHLVRIVEILGYTFYEGCAFVRHYITCHTYNHL